MQVPMLPSLWGFGLKLPRRKGGEEEGELGGEKEVGRKREGEENTHEQDRSHSLFIT